VIVRVAKAAGPPIHQEADYGKPRVPIGRRRLSNHRRLRGDACKPQRSAPLGAQGRCCSAAAVHPHNLRHRWVEPDAVHTADAGYTGGLNIENEDQFYWPNYEGADFTESFKEGFRVARAYVRRLVREAGQK